MTFETIRFDLANHVATLSIDRPARMNALNARVFADLTAGVDAALAGGARAIVLTGTGGAFCSGADLAEGGAVPRDLGDSLDAHYNPFVRKVAALDVPFLTAINGPAVGAGLGLALLGDISVMARSAYVLLAFVNIGLVPDAGATWLIAKAAGRTKALEMALLGERVSAEDALASGLVTRVVDDQGDAGAVLAETQALAAKLAAGPSVAIGLIRRQVAAALSSDLDQTLALERANQSRAGRTRDFAEAVRAFGEKRAPVFEGR